MSAQALWETLGRLNHGVYVIGVSDGQIRKAFTAAWVMQVSFQPLLLALSVNPHNSSYAVLKRGAVFSVNVLGQDQRDLAIHFGQPTPGRDKLDGIAWAAGKTGAPLLQDALAHIECEAIAQYPAGDHQLILGRVVLAELLLPGDTPLRYEAVRDIDGSLALLPERL